MSTNYENTCEHCGREFYAERSTKIYCSDSCRQLAYLDRRSRKSARASFIEETEYESIPEVQPHKIQQEIIEEIASTIDENNNEESNYHKTRTSGSCAKGAGVFKANTKSEKPNSNKDWLLLLGGAALGILAYNLFKKPEIQNRPNEPKQKNEKSSEIPDPDLKIDTKLHPISSIPGKKLVPLVRKKTEFNGFPSFESLKLPVLGKNGNTEAEK